MRQPNSKPVTIDPSTENASVLSAGPIPTITMGPEAFNDGEIVGSALLKNPVQEVVVAPSRRFRVMNDKPIGVQDDGFRAQLHPGKEISEAQYDIRKLQKQGVRLQEIKDESIDTALV